MPEKRTQPSPDLKTEAQVLKAALGDVENKAVQEAQLTGDRLQVVRDRLYRMIDYAVKRQDWYADQSHRLLQIGLALLAASAAIAAILVKVDPGFTVVRVLLWITVLFLGLTGVTLVYDFNTGIGQKHPYRKLVDIVSWYFAYTFPESLSPDLPPDEHDAISQVKLHKKYIEEYFKRFLTHASKAENLIREDIEQVSILLILQGYRSRQTARMAKHLYAGLFVTAVFFVGAVITGIATPLLPGSQQGTSASITASPVPSSGLTRPTLTPSPTTPASTEPTTPPAASPTTPVSPPPRTPRTGTRPKRSQVPRP